MAKKKKQEKTSRKKELGLPVVIVIMTAVGFILYWNTVGGSFVFDDYVTIVENREVRTGSVLGKMNIQRYVGLVSFAINYMYSELSPKGYHVVNIIIHIINGVLVYVLIRKILLILENQGRTEYHEEVPFIAAMLFLVHPVQTQAVAYIAQRFTSLAALFALIAMLGYMRFRSERKGSLAYLIISVIFALLAYKTKENTATLFLALVVFELVLFRDDRTIKERALYILPYILLIVVIPLSFVNIDKPVGELFGEISKASQETTYIGRWQYFLTQTRVIITYMRLIILPIRQSIEYLFPLSESLFEVRTVLAILFNVAVLALSVILYKKHPVITIGILWFFIFLAVESSIIPIRDVIFEHRVYLPSIGFIIALVYGIFLLERFIKIRYVLPGIFIIIMIVFGIAAYQRNALWGDSVLLWKDAVKKFPDDIRARGNLGVALAEHGKYEEAIKVLKEAVNMNSRSAINWYSLGACQKKLGLIDDAIRSYNKVLEMNPRFQKAAYDLADIYMQQRQFQTAYPILLQALQADEKHPYTNGLIAQYHCEMGDVERALTMMEKATKNGLDLPNSYFNMGICLLNHNALVEAQKYFFKTIELNSKEVDSYFFIGVTYDRKPDPEKAAYFYKTYLNKAKPDDPWVAEARERLQKISK